MWRSPNGTIRNILGGVVFRAPIICKNVPRLVPGWTQPIVIGRHAFGDQYKATDFLMPGPGKLTMKFVGNDGTVIEKEVFDAPSAGVAMGMYNLDDSIIDFARASMNYGLNLGWPVYLSTKNTILKAYDGRFKDLFQKVLKPSSPISSKQQASLRAPPDRRHGCLGDEMVGRLRLGLQELRRRRAVRHRGARLWLAWSDDIQLMTPDGKIVEAEAAHGTVTRHYRQHQAGQGNLDQLDRVDLCLDGWAEAPRETRRQRAADEVCRDTWKR